MKSSRSSGVGSTLGTTRGRFVALVKELEEANLDSGGGRRRVEVRLQDDATSLACRYDAMVLGGKVRAAVWMVTNRGTGGPYCPNDLDSKCGRPVIDVLQEKHPECVVPSEWDFDEYPDAADLLHTMPVYSATRSALQKQLVWCTPTWDKMLHT